MREAAPRHTIVAAGARWSSVDQLLLLEPRADRNVVYNFHFYEPRPRNYRLMTGARL